MTELITNYTRRMWENSPSIATPINETNLNAMDAGIDNLQTDTRTLNTAKAEQSDLLQSLKAIDYNETTGVFVFHWWNGTTKTVDLHIEAIPVHFEMDEHGVITMRTSDGTEYTADVSELIKTYTFVDSQTIDFTVTTDAEGHKTITADIVAGSITADKLQPNYLADVTAQANDASESATIAAQRADASAESAEDAEAWAVGQRGGVDVEDTEPQYNNNAKYWNDRAREVGTRDGHTIMNEAGVALAQQPNLQFMGMTVTDDATSGKTVITPDRIGVGMNLTWEDDVLQGYQYISTDVSYDVLKSSQWFRVVSSFESVAVKIEWADIASEFETRAGMDASRIRSMRISGNGVAIMQTPTDNIQVGDMGLYCNMTVEVEGGAYTEMSFNPLSVQGLFVNLSALPVIYSKGGLTSDGKTLIRFGQDAYGNYGYKKEGADTVIPFRNIIPIATLTTNARANSSGIASYARGHHGFQNPDTELYEWDTSVANWSIITLKKAGYYSLWFYGGGTASTKTVRYYPYGGESPGAMFDIYNAKNTIDGQWATVDRDNRTFELLPADSTDAVDIPRFYVEAGDKIGTYIQSSTTSQWLHAHLFYHYDARYDRFGYAYPVRVL